MKKICGDCDGFLYDYCSECHIIGKKGDSDTMNREHILEAAIRIVTGDREEHYGSPENNFLTISDLWNAYLGENITTPKDVAVMMILLKVARIQGGNGTPDNWIDIAGYAACGGEIESVEGP